MDDDKVPSGYVAFTNSSGTVLFRRDGIVTITQSYATGANTVIATADGKDANVPFSLDEVTRAIQDARDRDHRRADQRMAERFQERNREDREVMVGGTNHPERTVQGGPV